ncbi:MAG TPA: histidine kinase [Cyclobacteriaceae bacterium]|nr:histidine kinase [Cyclobacteriaceae bacterium]
MKISKGQIRTIIVCCAGGLIIPSMTCRTCLESPKIYFQVAVITTSLWIMMWFGNEFLSHYLDRKISWTSKPLKRFAAGIVGMVVYTVLATLFLIQLSEWIFKISLGNVSSMLYITVLVTFVITLFMTSRSFLFNWKQADINAEKLLRENLSARYENLKSQVNPHFLFNSLNALTNLVYEDQDKAVKFIKQLSDVYRYVLDTRDREVVSIQEELKFLTSYVYLQQIRFGEKLKININLNGTNSLVAPLALQMLIENAIKHNEVSEEKPLHVRIYADDHYLIVENNLQRKMNTEQGSSKIGLENIKKRYEYLSERGVLIEENASRFAVRLPLITEVH